MGSNGNASGAKGAVRRHVCELNGDFLRGVAVVGNKDGGATVGQRLVPRLPCWDAGRCFPRPLGVQHHAVGRRGKDGALRSSPSLVDREGVRVRDDAPHTVHRRRVGEVQRERQGRGQRTPQAEVRALLCHGGLREVIPWPAPDVPKAEYAIMGTVGLDLIQ